MTQSPLPPLPVVVISGYLGAGKTSLINKVLRKNQGRKIMVLVNDFGAINIDADLLQSADNDTLTLTNGCVCCTMGADLFMALGDALDRRPRPDILLIEASGIAAPSRIAEAAKADMDLRYGGIVTLVDALNFTATANDPQIGAQVRDQISAADLLLISKTTAPSPQLTTYLATLSPAQVLTTEVVDLETLLFASPKTILAHPAAHPAYGTWSKTGGMAHPIDDIRRMLAHPPKGVFRIKGKVLTSDAQCWEVHLVGQTVDIRPCPPVDQTQIIAIGPRGEMKTDALDLWWQAAPL